VAKGEGMRSGWPTFAAVVLAMAGVYHVLSGIGAITDDDRTEAVKEVLYNIDISAWGWFWVVLGVVQLVIAFLIFRRSPAGFIAGVTIAALSACFTVFLIFVFPLWAILVTSMNVLVIYALTMHDEEFV
jgi:hypothetical protein